MAIKRIHRKGPYSYDEATTVEAITPGMLVDRDTAGLLRKHNEQGGHVTPAFAIEDALQGRPVGTDYDASTIAGFILPRMGCEVNALIKSGEAAAIGDKFVSNGDGTLRRWGVGGSGQTEWRIIAESVEAFTTLSANTLKPVRML